VVLPPLLGLGELCLKLPVDAMPALPGYVIIMLPRKLYYAHILLNHVMEFNL